MKKLKPVFKEQGKGSEFNKLMQAYFEAADSTGAILLCVFRASLSEGFNFEDKKARCVIIVGVPFPNLHDPKVILKRQ